jgi:hypothetical protein
MNTMTSASTPKALLLAVFDELGEEPFFHLDVTKQAQRVDAASLLGLLECAFNSFEVPARSERLAPFFAPAIAAAEALDAGAVFTAVTEIRAVCQADADAWFAVHGDDLVV